MHKTKYSLLLVFATMIWGGAFIAQSKGAQLVGPFTFNSIRFFIGALSLVPAFIYMDKKEGILTHLYDRTMIVGGIVCGIALFMATTFQQIGMKTARAGKAGFITTLYIIMVPIFSIALRKIPKKNVWIAVVMAVIGMYFLCVNDGLNLEAGDIWLFLCAIFYALQILAVGKFAPHVDILKLSSLQFFVSALLGLIPMLFEAPTLPEVMACWRPIAYTGFLSCGVAYTLQMEAQKRITTSVASVIMSLESVFSLLFGIILLHESISVREAIGCAIMLGAAFVAEFSPREERHANPEMVK